MSRKIRNLVREIILFLPGLLGYCFLDTDRTKSVYFLTCLFIFLQTEVFYCFFQKGRRLWGAIGAALWLIICHIICPKTAAITGCRGVLWLILFIRLLIELLQIKALSEKQRWGNFIHYLTNMGILFNRYVHIPFMMILFGTVKEHVWYIESSTYEMNTLVYIITAMIWLLLMAGCAWFTHRKINKIKTKGITDCVMHASIYDCIEVYRASRFLMLQIELSNLTLHTTKDWWTGTNRIRNTYIGRYTAHLWDYVKEVPNKTCVLYWNSKKDRDWSKKELGKLQLFIEELEQYGCNIAIVDLYGGKKVYDKSGSIGTYLQKQFPYYYRNEMERKILFVKREKETYRELLIQIRETMEELEADQKKLLEPLSRQLTGNITSGVRCFYALMKLCEFVIHTEAITLLETAESLPKNLNKPSMGSFVQLLNREERITKENHEEVIQSARFIDCALMKNGKSQIKNSWVSYYVLCEKLVNLRNRLIGHGTMVYAVSEEMVAHLAQITLFLLQRFAEKKIKLDREKRISVQGNEVQCVFELHDRCCLYNGIEADGTVLYLDYVTGNTIYIQHGKKTKKKQIEVAAFQEYREVTA